MTKAGLPPALLIGVPFIDREHEDLVKYLDRLINRQDAIPGSAHFSESFSHLGQLLSEHFSNEERFIRNCGMPADDVATHLAACRA